MTPNRIDITGMTDQQWGGYITGAVEDIREDVKNITSKQETAGDLVTKMKLKIAAIGGTVALAVSMLCILLKSFLSHLMGAK